MDVCAAKHSPVDFGTLCGCRCPLGILGVSLGLNHAGPLTSRAELKSPSRVQLLTVRERGNELLPPGAVTILCDESDRASPTLLESSLAWEKVTSLAGIGEAGLSELNPDSSAKMGPVTPSTGEAFGGPRVRSWWL